MKRINNIIAATLITVVLSVGTTFGNSGILVAGFNDDTTPSCTETTSRNFDSGILVAGFTGILVAGFTGILVAGASDGPTECGILVAG